MMNRLKGSRCYLCGAMDRVKDGGVGWRTNLKTELEPLGIQWLDPTDKPCRVGREDNETRLRRRQDKEAGRYSLVASDMRDIRRVDLSMVRICDFVIVGLDVSVHCCGTYEELFLALQQDKPVLVCIEQGKKAAPDWLFGAMPHSQMFSDWDRLINYLKQMDAGEIDDESGRWCFFDWMGDE